MYEKTFVIFKPDCFKKALFPIVLKEIYENGLSLSAFKKVTPTKAKIKEHYNHIVNQPFYSSIENYMLSGDMYVGIIEGENAISVWRDVMGATNPKLANPNSIRGKYGEVTEKGDIYNVVHGSDSEESANREIALWFK